MSATGAGVARSLPGRLRSHVGTLRFRISALAVAAVLCVLTAVGVGLVLAQRATLLSDLDENLAHQAEVVAGRLQAGEHVSRAVLLTDDVAVLVSGPQGDTVAGAPGLIRAIFRYGSQPSRLAVATVPLAGPDGEARVLSRTAAGRAISVAAPMDDVHASTSALVRSLLLAVPVGAVVLGAVVWWAVGRTLRPVEAIRDQVERVSAQQLGRRVPEPPTSDEVSRLAHTMNAMLDRLESAADRQRGFVADASHELRSPLARIRTQLEVDAAHPESADQAATHASVLAETERLQRLVDDLLLLARGDAGALDVVGAEAVDLDAVAEKEAAARRGGHPRLIDTRAVAPAQVRGDRGQLERAVGNLLDNAVRHSSGQVTVTVTEGGGSVVLGVADDGPGIPAGSEEAVFQRFTRLDDARATSDGGAGLGLAIARDVAVRHGGTLAVERADGGGARFVLTLPADGVERACLG